MNILEKEESVNKKIDYIYDMLKKLTNSQINELIPNSENFNEKDKKVYNSINNTINNNINFSDNQKISFGIPKSPENPINSNDNYSINSLSPPSKIALAELEKMTKENILNPFKENPNKNSENNIFEKTNSEDFNVSDIISIKVEEDIRDNTKISENIDKQESDNQNLENSKENVEEINNFQDNEIENISNKNIMKVEDVSNLGDSSYLENKINNHLDNNFEYSKSESDISRYEFLTIPEVEKEENSYYEEKVPRSLDNCIITSNSNIDNQNDNWKNLENLEINVESKLNIIDDDKLNNRFEKDVEKLKNNSEKIEKSNENSIVTSYIQLDTERTNISNDNEIKTPRKNIRVEFSKKIICIEYDDDSYAEDIKVFDKSGTTEKFKKFNFLKYLIKLKNNKYKSKNILHKYYDGIRDDKLPTNLQSTAKRSNSFSEQDKEIGLKKLNEFLEECDKDNDLKEKKLSKKKIGNFKIYFFLVERNLNTIQEIEEARKNGTKIQKNKSQTPKKIINSHICDKFKEDPKKFYTNYLSNSNIKTKNSEKNNNNLKESFSTGKLNDEYSVKYSSTKLQKIDHENKLINNTETNGQNDYKLNTYSFNTNKEKDLNNIISNLNLNTPKKNLKDQILDKTINNRNSNSSKMLKYSPFKKNLIKK